MAMIEVSRTELAELLGLAPDADDETLLRAMDGMAANQKAAAHHQAAAVSVAEQRARAEDYRLVADAVEAGRISAGRVDFWCEAMRKDRSGNRAVLASLVPGLTFGAAGTRTPDAAPGDAEMATVYAKVTGAPLDRARVSRQAPAPAATAQPAQNLDDALYAEVAWRLGPSLRAGLDAPAANPVYFENPDAPRIAMNADGSGSWADPGQERREASMREQSLKDKAARDRQAEREADAQAKYRDEKQKWSGM